MKVEILEVAGIIPAMQALRLPYGKEPRSESRSVCGGDGRMLEFANTPYYGYQQERVEYIHKEDIALAQKLIKAGDEHGKILRGCMAYLRVTAPIGWWMEAVTYRIGCECLSSTSTMHSECKGLQGEELQKAKYSIPLGHEQTRILAISFQTLRRIWRQRRNHRLPEWHTFIDACRQLPFANELIFVE